MGDDLNFDFESNLEVGNLLTSKAEDHARVFDTPITAEEIGQQPGNYKKNFRQTVCTYWLRGLCMKGDSCGFLHQFAQDKMPVCRALLKFGVCKEPDCPFKHDTDEIKECNMYKLGFCIYGPQCRYKHKKSTGPPPELNTVEAAKPRDYRDINRVVNQVNPGVIKEEDMLPFRKRGRFIDYGEGKGDCERSFKALPAPVDEERSFHGGGRGRGFGRGTGRDGGRGRGDGGPGGRGEWGAGGSGRSSGPPGPKVAADA
eukprot:gene17221-23543_t